MRPITWRRRAIGAFPGEVKTGSPSENPTTQIIRAVTPFDEKRECSRGAFRDPRAGFLLVEALATMAISAFLLIALASTVALMLRASDRTARSGQAVEDASRLLASLTREIEQIAPLRWAGKGAGFVFAGDERGLTFAQAHFLTGGAQSRGAQSSLAVTIRSQDGLLVRSDAPLLPDAMTMADLAPSERQEMTGDRLRVRFAYFGRLETGQETLTDTWLRSDLMPVAIRITLTDADGTLRGSVRVPMMVDAEPGCAAPGKAVCSFFVDETEDGGDAPAADAPIDPDDALGWLRYLR